MDRYEYNVKSDQIKKLFAKKDYETVAVIADTIDWSRVKNNSMLAMVADTYEATKQYEKARNILEIAFERSPMGRQLAYRLTIISIRMRDFVAADEYYQEFVELAPRDVAQYILKYRIARAKGEDISTLINILEAYVDVEMDERWQYELAKLYHESGEDDKCVSMCDKIILWFSEGKYVTKALELKMKHQPLTEEQQAKYDGKWDYYNERIKSEEQEKEQENRDEVTKEEEPVGGNESVPTDEKAEVQNEGYSGNDNFVEEMAVRDILNDTTALDYLTDYSEEEKLIHEPKLPDVDEETAVEVEQQLARIVEESVESAKNQINADGEENVREYENFQGDMQEESLESESQDFAEDDGLEEDTEDNVEDMDDTELVAKAYTSEDEEDIMKEDEEMELESENIHVDKAGLFENQEFTEESQIKSDSKIEIFEFDESKSGKVKNIGDELLKTAEIDIDEINLQVQPVVGAAYDTANIQEALAQSMKIILQAESEKATKNAFSSPEIMDEPTKRIEKEETVVTDISEQNVSEQKEAAQERERKKPVYETVPLQPIYDREEDGQITLSEPAKEEEQVDGQMDMEEVLLEMEKRKREALEEAARKEEEAREVAMRAAHEAAAARAAVEKAMAEEAAARAALQRVAKTQETLVAESILPEDMEAVQNESQYVEETAFDNDIDQVIYSGEDTQEQSDKFDETQEDATEIPLSYEAVDDISEAHNDTGTFDNIESGEENTSTGLSDEYKKMFVDFLDILGLEEQIAAALDSLINNFVKDGTSKTNNVMIMGDAKSGKTTLALGVIKAANKGRGRSKRKVAKVKASALNKKGISAAMSQILGTDLIIEQAGNLMPGTVVDLIAAMKAYTEEMIIVLEDDKAALERLVTANPILEDMFNNQISIKEFDIDDFVKLGKEYAETKNYVIDEMGTLALYAKIDDFSGKNQGISRSELHDIIDEAIVHAERFKISKLIDKLKRTHFEMGVLKEEDF